MKKFNPILCFIDKAEIDDKCLRQSRRSTEMIAFCFMYSMTMNERQQEQQIQPLCLCVYVCISC